MTTLKFMAVLGLGWTLFILTIFGIIWFNWWRKYTDENEPTETDLDKWTDNEKTDY